jgi:hypothetical protein
LFLSEDILHALEGLYSMGLNRYTVKYKHLLKAVLLILEEVQMTAEKYKKHMLSYIGYMALDTGNALCVWKRKLTFKIQGSKKVATGTMMCELALGL